MTSFFSWRAAGGDGNVPGLTYMNFVRLVSLPSRSIHPFSWALCHSSILTIIHHVMLKASTGDNLVVGTTISDFLRVIVRSLAMVLHLTLFPIFKRWALLHSLQQLFHNTLLYHNKKVEDVDLFVFLE